MENANWSRICPVSFSLGVLLPKTSLEISNSSFFFFENIVDTKENTGNKHFLLFPQYFLSFQIQNEQNLNCCLEFEQNKRVVDYRICSMLWNLKLACNYLHTLEKLIWVDVPLLWHQGPQNSNRSKQYVHPHDYICLLSYNGYGMFKLLLHNPDF